MGVIFTKKTPRKNWVGKKLYDLGREVYVEVSYRLMCGEDCKKVAVYLQNDLKVLLDLKTDTLRRYLHRFREKVIYPRLAKTYEVLNSTTRIAYKKDIELKIDGLRILEVEILDQKKRVEAIRRREVKLADGMTLGVLSKEKLLLANLTERYMRLKLDAGFVDKMGTGPLIQINNQQLSIEHIQKDILNKEEIALATQKALSVLCHQSKPLTHAKPTHHKRSSID